MSTDVIAARSGSLETLSELADALSPRADLAAQILTDAYETVLEARKLAAAGEAAAHAFVEAFQSGVGQCVDVEKAR